MLAVEVFVLDQAEAAGLEEIIARIAILNRIAGRRRRTDRVALLMTRGLRSKDPSRCDRPFVAQRVVASAEVLAAEVRARIAAERVIVVVDRAAVRARILEECCDQRLARGDVVRGLAGTSIAAALRSDDLS